MSRMFRIRRSKSTLEDDRSIDQHSESGKSTLSKKISRRFSRFKFKSGKRSSELSLDQSSFMSDASTVAADSPVGFSDSSFTECNKSASSVGLRKVSSLKEDVDRMAETLRVAYDTHQKFVEEARTTLDNQHHTLNVYLMTGMAMFLTSVLFRAYQEAGIPLLNIPPPQLELVSGSLFSIIAAVCITIVSGFIIVRAEHTRARVTKQLSSTSLKDDITKCNVTGSSNHQVASDTNNRQNSLTRNHSPYKCREQLDENHEDTIHNVASSPTTQRNLIRSPDGSICGNAKEIKQITELRQAVKNKVKQLEMHYRKNHPDLVGESESLEAKFPHIVSDQVLLRFLHGHDTVKKAKEKFETMIQWRIDDDIAKFEPDVAKVIKAYRAPDNPNPRMDSLPHWDIIAPYLPCDLFAGTSPNGDNFCWEKTGQISPKGILENVSEERLFRFHFVHMEAKSLLFHKETLRRTNEYVKGNYPCETSEQLLCKSILLKDISGLGWKHMNKAGLALLKKVLTTSQWYYPEQLRVCFLVHIPSVFAAIWKIVKLALDKVTVEKVKIYGQDKSWKAQLVQLLGGRDDMFVQHVV